VINVGADQPYTILELVEAIGRAFGTQPELTHLPARQEVVHAFSSHEKASRIFGMPARIGLEEGIARMARWVQQTGARPPVVFPGKIEVPTNMPPSWAAMAQQS
jgi:UDP-glucose 4-epimerase